MRFIFIKAEKVCFPITLLCKVLQVSRSGYYAWMHRRESRRAREDRRLLVHIKAIHKQSRGIYGSLRVHAELKAQGERCGKHRVARLMRQEGLYGKQRRRFKATTDSNHKQPVAPNILAGNFQVEGPDQVWAGDLTYIRTEEGWFYLAVILDLFSRRIVGWALGVRMTRHLVLEALRNAVGLRCPPAGLLHHSDRGSQYASGDYQKELAKHGMVVSMSRKGCCWDNAVCESFFHTLKTEQVYHCRYRTREEARQDIRKYIEVFYNNRRRHSSLGYMSPAEFEATAFTTALAA